MKKFIYIFGGILIAAGILVAAYPFWKEKAQETKQREILNRWETELEALSFAEDAGYVPEEENDVFLSEERVNTFDEETSDEDTFDESVVCVLRIPAIELEQPVLQGATEKNLSIAPSTIEPTDSPGTNGNFAVAGHHSRTYGRHFNRLKELAAGDEIEVETADGIYTYSVVSSYVVEPDEVWVLEHRMEEPEITLITCDYSGGGQTRRLVVKGVLVQ